MEPPADITETITSLHLSHAQFSLVNMHRYESILLDILEKFTTLGNKGLNALWWWESFKGEKRSLQTDSATAVISQLFAADTPVWFVAEDRMRKKKHGNSWLYEGLFGVALAVLEESYLSEYYIVDKKLDWLVCENHHSIVIGVGERVRLKMQSLDFSQLKIWQAERGSASLVRQMVKSGQITPEDRVAWYDLRGKVTLRK